MTFRAIRRTIYRGMFCTAPFSSAEDYLDRYPGDAYVDVFGFDFYDDDDDTPAFMERLEHAAALVVSAANAHGKLPALTEVGVHKNGGGLALTGNDDPHWTSAAAAVARRHHIPYLMTWARTLSRRRRTSWSAIRAATSSSTDSLNTIMRRPRFSPTASEIGGDCPRRCKDDV